MQWDPAWLVMATSCAVDESDEWAPQTSNHTGSSQAISPRQPSQELPSPFMLQKPSIGSSPTQTATTGLPWQVDGTSAPQQQAGVQGTCHSLWQALAQPVSGTSDCSSSSFGLAGLDQGPDSAPGVISYTCMSHHNCSRQPQPHTSLRSSKSITLATLWRQHTPYPTAPQLNHRLSVAGTGVGIKALLQMPALDMRRSGASEDSTSAVDLSALWVPQPPARPSPTRSGHALAAAMSARARQRSGAQSTRLQHHGRGGSKRHPLSRSISAQQVIQEESHSNGSLPVSADYARQVAGVRAAAGERVRSLQGSRGSSACGTCSGASFQSRSDLSLGERAGALADLDAGIRATRSCGQTELSQPRFDSGSASGARPATQQSQADVTEHAPSPALCASPANQADQPWLPAPDHTLLHCVSPDWGSMGGSSGSSGEHLCRGTSSKHLSQALSIIPEQAHELLDSGCALSSSTSMEAISGSNRQGVLSASGFGTLGERPSMTELCDGTLGSQNGQTQALESQQVCSSLHVLATDCDAQPRTTTAHACDAPRSLPNSSAVGDTSMSQPEGPQVPVDHSMPPCEAPATALAPLSQSTATGPASSFGSPQETSPMCSYSTEPTSIATITAAVLGTHSCSCSASEHHHCEGPCTCSSEHKSSADRSKSCHTSTHASSKHRPKLDKRTKSLGRSVSAWWAKVSQASSLSVLKGGMTVSQATAVPQEDCSVP